MVASSGAAMATESLGAEVDVAFLVIEVEAVESSGAEVVGRAAAAVRRTPHKRCASPDY